MSPHLTPEHRAEIAAVAERDAASTRARTELRFARRHREAGELGLAAACLDFAAEARTELSDLLAAQTMARQIGAPEHRPEK